MSADRFSLGRFSLGRRASFWLAAGVVAHTLWTSAAPSMTYPLYAAAWQLSPTMTTAIYAAYPITVVLVLTLFGDLADIIGRRLTIVAGLSVSLAGVLLFAAAPGLGWIVLGRVLMGIGVGLSVGPATAAMVEFSAPGQAGRASAITAASQGVGLAGALLVGGGLIQYASLPTQLNFIVLAILVAALLVASWFLPRPVLNAEARQWRVRLPTVPRGQGAIFLAGVAAVAGAYPLGGMMLSLGAHMARDLIGSPNALINASVLAVLPIAAAIVGMLSRRIAPTAAIVAGGLSSALGMTLLVLAAERHSLGIFQSAIAATGIGYSLMFLGGLGLLNAHVPANRRAGVLSAVYLLAYLSQGVTALALGAAATAWGLRLAIDLGSAVLASVAIIAALLAIARRPVRGLAVSPAE